MRRLAIASVILAVLAALVVLLVVKPTSHAADPYHVRAIFDNASAVVTGEDVRIAGAPVGTIVAEGVTDRNKAVLTLEINKSAFVPFHANATCAIRVQSVIGEKFVDCRPGTSQAPVLTKIHSGPGAGDHYLPVTNTHSPVDFDIVQNIYRQPVRQQFALILNELGTGLAARGTDLNQVIRRADPALGYTDRVLKILARQNRQLAQLATDSNTALRPLARFKHELAGFVVNANTTSSAAAVRSADEARSFHLLPKFLAQLRPLMSDLGSLADQGTPLFNTLSQAASSINSQYQHLAPFARATRTSLIALGRSAAIQEPALLATIPLARRLDHLGTAALPTGKLLDRLLNSFQKTGGIQQLMALLLNGTGATNGFDADGHYIRTESLFGSCTPYQKVPFPGCSANFVHEAAARDATQANLSSHAPRVARALRSLPHHAPARASHVLSRLLSFLLGGAR